jgi:hypothetical protein
VVNSCFMCYLKVFQFINRFSKAVLLSWIFFMLRYIFGFGKRTFHYCFSFDDDGFLWTKLHYGFGSSVTRLTLSEANVHFVHRSVTTIIKA